MKSMKFNWGNVITLVSALFVAGAAWGVSNSKIEVNAKRIDSFSSEVTSSEKDLKQTLEDINSKIAALNIRMAEVAKDIHWIKENSKRN